MLRPANYKRSFLDDMFEDFFDDSFFRPMQAPKVSAMKTDITESENAYQVDMELPGFAKEEVEAELKEGYLIVRATHKAENKEEKQDKKYIRRERYYGQYQRSFYVGDEIKQEDIGAKFSDGVLRLTIPKKEPQRVEQAQRLIPIEG